MDAVLIIGERYRKKLENPLKEQGFSVLWMPDNKAVDPRLAGHADLSAVCIGKNETKKIILSPNVCWPFYIVSYLSNNVEELLFAYRAQGSEYPWDASLCACILGNFLLHNPKITDDRLRENFMGTCFSVRQGYAKCMTCVVNASSVITADAGIAAAAEKNGITVLRITPGFITLGGFDRGFIGGASFSTERAVYFTGDVFKHPDGNQIVDFIEKRSKKVVSLSSEPLFDIGGAVVL